MRKEYIQSVKTELERFQKQGDTAKIRSKYSPYKNSPSARTRNKKIHFIRISLRSNIELIRGFFHRVRFEKQTLLKMPNV